MTDTENLQVAQYVAGLKAAHAAEMQKLRADCQAYFDNMVAQHRWELEQHQEVRAELNKKLLHLDQNRKYANSDRDKMGQAVHEIWKLASTQSTTTPQQLAVYVRQIINHYCPDFDIPY